MYHHQGMRDGQDDDDEQHHHHPQHGVESHEVGAAARLRPEVVPAPSAVIGGFDLVFTVWTGDVVPFCGPSIHGTLRSFSRVRHEVSFFAIEDLTGLVL